MYAIVEASGRQWKVTPGTRFEINRIGVEVGARHTLEQVLLTYNGQGVEIGRPYIQGAKVLCEVLAHQAGPKVISYHFRRRENWRKTVGHRQPLTQLLVTDVVFSDGKMVGQAVAAEPPVKPVSSTKLKAGGSRTPKASAKIPTKNGTKTTKTTTRSRV